MDKKILDTLQQLNKRISHIEKSMTTKDDLKSFATKVDLKDFATKDDLKDFATKDDLKDVVTKNYLSQQLSKLREDITADIVDVNTELINRLDDKKADKTQVALLDARVAQIENKVPL